MRLRSSTPLAAWFLLAMAFSCEDVQGVASVAEDPAPADVEVTQHKLREQPLHAKPTDLFLVTRVVDGDTIHVERDGEVEKLRLLSVDTEEVIRGGGSSNASKPQTLFGTECAEWAKSFFDELKDAEGQAYVGLWFPGGVESRDVYGRLLCNVVLPDGTDFNLLLLEKGKSPYFNKYGNSSKFDPEFRAAQAEAREAQLGIWNPETNQPTTPGAPAVRRPYETLMPWWEARARAIDEFRSKRETDLMRFVDAGAPDQLEATTRSKSPNPAEVEVFGAPDRVFNEKDGSQTVLFRTSDRGRALRVRIPKEAVSSHAELDLANISEELRQNYVWVTGEMSWTGRGYEIISQNPQIWRIADPQGQN